ncbi:MAG: hypothetical protein R3300_11355 [Candidatus Promineifilaceae bacterium]|nr:hypothetical protein [Candidatus Promineifilaceae bacterium]
MSTTVCRIDRLYHYQFQLDPEKLEAIVEQGLQPLSVFRDSPRWLEIQQSQPDFFERLYDSIAAPVLSHPYANSGVFLTPIDFRLLPGTYLHDKPRFVVPLERLDPEWTVITYVLNNQRVSLPLTPYNLQAVADLWDESLVREWFAKDQTKVFFYVPQVAAYQPGGIPVTAADLERVDEPA